MLYVKRTATSANTVLSNYLQSAAHMQLVEQCWWGSVFVYQTGRFEYVVAPVDYKTGPTARGVAEANVHEAHGVAQACVAHERWHNGQERVTQLSRHVVPMGVL